VPPQVPSDKPKPSLPVEVAKPVELIKKPTIYQSGAGKQSPIRRVVEGLGSDGVLAQALDESAEKVNLNVGTAIPELFRSVLHSPGKENTVAKDAVKVKSNATANLLRLSCMVEDAMRTLYEQWVPPHGQELAVSLRKWWTQERLSRRVEACLPNRELDVVIVDGRIPIRCRFLCSCSCLQFFRI
jgi:nucleoporin NDC1